jgi:type II secretory ATPase GspE/PulE/Tfp pilus assembly ATPase PilB-like protein
MKYEWEITTAGSTAGEQVKITKIEDYSSRKVDDIGLHKDQLEKVKGFRDFNSGVILLTGPSKSGITTTLYAMLRNHDPFLNNINTLEKKLAAELQNISQNVYSLSDTGTTTYAKRLQSILRLGPNIVGVEDVEDTQCATLCCQAAKDSQIIYPCFDAPNSMQALAKWLKMVDNKQLVAETLVAVINQRLVRVLCDECKQAYQPNQELLRKFNIPADKVDVLYRPGEIEHDKHGRPVVCEKCQGTGFYGRTGIFETAVIDDNLRKALNESKSIKELAAVFRRSGMLYLQEQAIRKVVQGITSINEVIRHFSNSQQKSIKEG